MLKRGIIGAFVRLNGSSDAGSLHLIHCLLMETADIVQALRHTQIRSVCNSGVEIDVIFTSDIQHNLKYMLSACCHCVAKLYCKAVAVSAKLSFPHLLFSVQGVNRIAGFFNLVLVRLNGAFHHSGIRRRNGIPHGGNIHCPRKTAQRV